jgi:N-hydroxyarylamine O-acetyltransferase
LDPQLRARLLERLGLSAVPSLDIDGLTATYGAWCRSVPFSNLTKLIALRSQPREQPLPGIDAVEFLERYLIHGVGGTCWTSSNALYTLLAAIGFDARRVAGSMRDNGRVSHASVKVRFGESDWLVDSSMLTNIPLPLGEDTFVSSDPVFSAEVEAVDGTHVIWTDLPPNATYLPCRLLVDPAEHSFYVERWEASRERSPFNERAYARTNLGGDMLVLSANTRIRKSAGGVETAELTPQQLCESLRDEFGVSGEYVDAWRKCGALEATFQPATTPPPPPITQKRPSQRKAS